MSFYKPTDCNKCNAVRQYVNVALKAVGAKPMPVQQKTVNPAWPTRIL